MHAFHPFVLCSFSYRSHFYFLYRVHGTYLLSKKAAERVHVKKLTRYKGTGWKRVENLESRNGTREWEQWRGGKDGPELAGNKARGDRNEKGVAGRMCRSGQAARRGANGWGNRYGECIR